MRPVAALVFAVTATTAGTAAAERTPRALTAPGAIRDRVMLARWGASGLAADALAPTPNADADPGFEAFPAVEVTADGARLLVESDDARLLVWVAATDLAWTVARPTRLIGAGAVGAWALPGAPLAVTGDGTTVTVRWSDVGVTLDGTVAWTALTHRFRPPALRRQRDDGAIQVFHASPDGPVLVSFPDGVPVRIVKRGAAGWILVEHVGPTVRVVGWARRADLAEAMVMGNLTGELIGTGDTRAAPRLHLDAGACLYDERGAPVGVQLAPGDRPGTDLGGGRWGVDIGTPWRSLPVIVVDRHAGRGAPVWRRCR